VIWGIHRVIVEEPGLRGFSPSRWVIYFQRFEETYCHSFQGWVNSLTHSAEYESCTFLRNAGNKLPIHKVQQPRRPGSSKRKPLRVETC